MNLRTPSVPLAGALCLALGASALSAQHASPQKLPSELHPGGDVKTYAPPPAGKPLPSVLPTVEGVARSAGKPSARPGTTLPAGASTAAPLGLAENRVLHDDRADGTLFVDGRTWKGSLDATGFTYVPFLGSQASKNHPVRFTVRAVRVGGKPLDLAANVLPKRDAERVVFARGPVEEIYDLSTTSVEQTIRVAAGAGEGAVRVEIAVDSDLPELAGMPGIQFGNELGRVDYGAAFVVRGDGTKAAIEATFVDGTIVLDVPAELREAGLPVTIDPVISTFQVGNTSTYALRSPDVSFDVSNNTYLMVWERVFSASDSDVLCEFRTRSGAYVPSSYGVVDNSGDAWSSPRVANLRAYSRFLVVAQVAGTPSVIKGRTRDAALAGSMGPQFVVSGPEGGDKVEPDVGGDPNQATPTYWAVVYTRRLSATDSDIHVRLIDSTGTAHGSTILLSNSSATLDYSPAISNSDGNVSSNLQRWFLVWTRAHSSTDQDIYGATIAWDGVVVKAPYGIDLSVSDDYLPTVSSPADALAGNPGYLVAFQRSSSLHTLGIVQDANGNSQTVLTDLTTLQGGSIGSSQQPSVDSDGQRFALCYFEGMPLYVTSFHVAYGALVLTESRKVVDASANAFNGRICSTHASGGGNLEYLLAYEDLVPNPQTIRGANYFGHATGGFSQRSTGCYGLGLVASGFPVTGRTVNYTMTGVASDLTGILVGVPQPTVTLCGACGIGVDLAGPLVNLPNQASVDLPIPAQGAFIGQTFTVQGYAVGTPTCFSLLRLSDTIDTKVQ